MAIVPLGFMRSETNEHMKEGKQKGYGPNMAGPMTYAWFYERVKYGWRLGLQNSESVTREFW